MHAHPTSAAAPGEGSSGLTAALEDYLETIYLLVARNGVARVRDICLARDVKAGSVTPAMRRLAELKLIVYGPREGVELTPEGERLARRVLARHELLTRFFRDVLGMSPEGAEADACAMEHHLSDEGVDRLTRLIEFIQHRDTGGSDFVNRFRSCRVLNPESAACVAECEGDLGPACLRGGPRPGMAEPVHFHVAVHPQTTPSRLSHGRKAETEDVPATPDGPPTAPGAAAAQGKRRSLADLQPGESAIIAQVNAQGAVRRRLLDMGLLPQVEVRMRRVGPTGDPLWIGLKGYELSLRRSEADAVLLAP